MKKSLNFVPFVFIILLLQTFCYAQWSDAYISDFQVNDDTTGIQNNSKIGVDSASNFVVVWQDQRNSDYMSQVYCQIFNKWGTRIGNNFKIGHDTTMLHGVTVLKDGRFIVAWYKAINRNQYAELYFQRFNINGAPLSPPTRVVDTVFSSIFTISPGDIDADLSGSLLYLVISKLVQLIYFKGLTAWGIN
jgi:hypothetical protein